MLSHHNLIFMDIALTDCLCMQVMHAFAAENDSHLTIAVGDVVVVTCRSDSHWFEGCIEDPIVDSVPIA